MASPALPTTFALLANQIEDHALRTDIDDEGVSALVIGLAEANFNRELRTVDMLTHDTAFTVDSQYETVPTGLLDVVRFALVRTPQITLEPLTPREISEKRLRTDVTGVPCSYSIVGANFEFYPTPTTAYTGDLLYYTQITALSASNTTNWLLDSHPDLYLDGCLYELYDYLKSPEEADRYERRRDSKIASLNRQQQRKQSGRRMVAPAIG